jgi:hypothetical protein
VRAGWRSTKASVLNSAVGIWYKHAAPNPRPLGKHGAGDSWCPDRGFVIIDYKTYPLARVPVFATMVAVPESIVIGDLVRSYFDQQSALALAQGELMPVSSPTLFGRVFQVFLSRADIDHRELGRYLGLDQATIRDLEISGMGGLGKTVLLTQQFYERLRHVPGFSDEAINLLEKAREIDELTFSESFTDPSEAAIISPPMPSSPGENEHSLAKHISDLQSQAKFGDERKPPIHYSHTSVPDHASRLVDEGKWEQEPKKGGIIYDRGRITTLDHAARVTGVKLGTIYNLLNDGKLTEQGRIKAHGGGKVLIDLDELDSIPKRPVGRPKKSPERPSRKRPRGRPRKNP